MAILEKYQRDLLYYQFQRFNDIDYINHLFTSRIGWNNDNLKSNISELFSVPENRIIAVKQVHGTNIKIIDSELIGLETIMGLEADGLITNYANNILTTYHADCVPIYFIDTVKKVIGIAHGGWRGTFENISGKMVDTMIDVYNSSNKDILVGIGPSIGPCCYEISEDLGERFTNKYCDFKNILIKKEGRTFLDLWKINYFQVKEKGVPNENIILSSICTSCKTNKFHSYRKESGTNKRMVAAIGLVGKP